MPMKAPPTLNNRRASRTQWSIFCPSLSVPSRFAFTALVTARSMHSSRFLVLGEANCSPSLVGRCWSREELEATDGVPLDDGAFSCIEPSTRVDCVPAFLDGPSPRGAFGGIQSGAGATHAADVCFAEMGDLSPEIEIWFIFDFVTSNRKLSNSARFL